MLKTSVYCEKRKEIQYVSCINVKLGAKKEPVERRGSDDPWIRKLTERAQRMSISGTHGFTPRRPPKPDQFKSFNQSPPLSAPPVISRSSVRIARPPMKRELDYVAIRRTAPVVKGKKAKGDGKEKVAPTYASIDHQKSSMLTHFARKPFK